METTVEIGVCTELSGENCCLKMFDLGSGMDLRAYKDGVAGAHCASLDHRDYIISGLHGKQIIHIWDKWKEQVFKKIVCPGKISSLAVSPDGNYCVVALVEKIYIWQIPTGNLMCVLTKHYQPVTCLKFLDSGLHFLSGGDDGQVISWSLTGVLSPTLDFSDKGKSQHILHSWSHHSLPVCDIFVGTGGIRCRVVTASLDQTCKLYDFASGRMLCSLIFDGGITSVTMGGAEYQLFAGGIKGSISIVNLFKPGIQKETYIRPEESTDKKQLLGHSKQVTSLSVTMDGCMLLSGSLDCTCRLWHVNSRQCVWTINLKGGVNNSFIIKTPPQLWQPTPTSKCLAPIGNFKRVVFVPGQNNGDGNYEEQIESESSVPVILREISRNDHFTKNDGSSDAEDRRLFANIFQQFGKPKTISKSSLSRAELEDKVASLENSNQQLRQFISRRLISRMETDNDALDNEN